MLRLAALVSVFACVSAHAATAPIHRFSKPFDQIAKHFQTNNPEQAADNLLGDIEARMVFFNLEALGRTYQDDINKPDMEAFKKDFNFFEDTVGEFKDGDDDVKAEARKELIDFLRKGWIGKKISKTKLGEWMETIYSADWPGVNKDRKIVIEHIAGKTIDKVMTNMYNLSILNNIKQGNTVVEGVHEMRRNIRFIAMEMQATDGMILFKPDVNSCPVPEFSTLPFNGSKYQKLDSHPAENNPCFISRCLFLALSDAVDKIGEVKNQLEAKKVNNLPPQIQAQMQGILDQLRNTGALETLQSELNSCI